MLRAHHRSLPSPAATFARRLGVLVTAIAVTCLLLVVGCGDDDDSDPTGSGEDTTAPRIASVTPIADDTAVAPNTDVVVVFDEDMDPASAAGHVVLSSGAVTGTTWDDARTLRIEHTPWEPGVRVEVTLTTGLADAAGNGLAVDHTFGFWTATDDGLLLLATPRNGATGVPVNTTVTLLFNRTMDLDALTPATTVDDGTDSKAPAAFAYRRGSVEPANGTAVDPATSTIVFTFSEPIDVTRFEPSTIAGQLLLMLESIDDRIDVRGTADPWPVVDDRTQTWRDFETVTEGDATLWYAPGVGLVREATDEQDHVEDRVATYDEWLFTSTDDGGSGAKARR